MHTHTTELRVRYSEIDQLGTVYNSRVLEWFEVGRGEFLRSLGKPYAQLEREGVCLPLVTAHVEYVGRAGYDDRLAVATSASMAGKARVRFEVDIQRDDARAVARGYTIHAVTDAAGKPARPPSWLAAMLAGE